MERFDDALERFRGTRLIDVDVETEIRIVEKVEFIEKAVTVLSRKQSLGKEEYLDDREQLTIVERECQTALEACIDIAEIPWEY